MTTTEHQELNVWIGNNVTGIRACIFEPHPVNNAMCDKCGRDCSSSIHNVTRYTTDPAAAMNALKKCAEKCGVDSVEIYHNGKCFGVSQRGTIECYQAETLELAICLFAKKLFEK